MSGVQRSWPRSVSMSLCTVICWFNLIINMKAWIRMSNNVKVKTCQDHKFSRLTYFLRCLRAKDKSVCLPVCQAINHSLHPECSVWVCVCVPEYSTCQQALRHPLSLWLVMTKNTACSPGVTAGYRQQNPGSYKRAHAPTPVFATINLLQGITHHWASHYSP